METSRSQPRTSFTGRRRVRTSRRRVVLADRLARALITLGGLGTILAVMLVCVFLVWVVIPLFLPDSLERVDDLRTGGGESSAVAVHLAVDEHLNLICVARSDGSLETYRADNGQRLHRRQLFDRQPVAWSYSTEGGHVAYAFDDGTLRLGSLRFATTFLSGSELPEEIRALCDDGLAAFADGVVQRSEADKYRFQQLEVDLQDPVPIDSDSPILLLDQSVSSRGRVVAVLTADGQLRVAQVTERKNLLTGDVTVRLREGVVPVLFPGDAPPAHLKLWGLGDSVLLAWEDGYAQRFYTRDVTQPVLAESLTLVSQRRARLTSLGFLVGKSSLIAADSAGSVHVWFRTRPEDASTPDGTVLVRARELTGGSGAVHRLAASPRSRLLGTAGEDGSLRLYHVTTGRKQAVVPAAEEAGSIQALALAPRDDALLSWSDRGVEMWRIDAPHPEVSFGTMLRPVWYEGYEHPQHVWQSSSGTDDFEEKYGLVPLIFGTLKATLYSMLFGAPLALLAAIYTSEFLEPRVKARVKPTIEMMASLPSVVLGFLAAIVFAPLVENLVAECLTAFVTVPFAFLLGAHLWQLLPRRVAVRARRLRIAGMLLALLLGLYLAAALGGTVQRWLFAGSIRAWLDGQVGTGVGGWMFILLPLSALAVGWFSASRVTPLLRRRAGHWSQPRFALLALARFLVGCAAVLLLAWAVAWVLRAAGWDPRGSVVGTYVQRNALVVGFIMGFAIIPIIYTISDDALSAVPESLRAGSLGAGATPWQTAVRVVIPTAMSGLFSAMMIGLGRAVGETMIVLVAAGNTPLMDLNIFNGFRTLSANIAVELPEAVVYSTHYRILFLTALTLFAMTFAVNTVAELVRLRFRRRAFQL